MWSNEKNFGTQNKEKYAVNILKYHGTDTPDVRQWDMDSWKKRWKASRSYRDAWYTRIAGYTLCAERRSQLDMRKLGRMAGAFEGDVIRKSSPTTRILKSSVFWEITPRRYLKVNQYFGGTCRLHPQSRRIRQAKNQHESRWQAGLPVNRTPYNYRSENLKSYKFFIINRHEDELQEDQEEDCPLFEAGKG
jgi:hypothetical protein